jgi:hypothetical protein
MFYTENTGASAGDESDDPTLVAAAVGVIVGVGFWLSGSVHAVVKTMSTTKTVSVAF